MDISPLFSKLTPFHELFHDNLFLVPELALGTRRGEPIFVAGTEQDFIPTGSVDLLAATAKNPKDSKGENVKDRPNFEEVNRALKTWHSDSVRVIICEFKSMSVEVEDYVAQVISESAGGIVIKDEEDAKEQPAPEVQIIPWILTNNVDWYFGSTKRTRNLLGTEYHYSACYTKAFSLQHPYASGDLEKVLEEALPKLICWTLASPKLIHSTLELSPTSSED